MTKLFSNTSKNRKLIIIILCGVIFVLGLSAYLNFPLMQNAGISNGYPCSRAHIYIPRRLDFKGCKTVTGTIQMVKIEPDGDSHALLQLDDQYKLLLTRQNYDKQQGYLVIEDTCHSKPKDVLAKLICHNYTSTLPNPELGKRYEITGNYVIDDWHGGWAEIHGVSELKLLN